MNREIFIKNTARMLLLGAFAGGVAYLGTKGKINNPGKCGKDNPCEKCGSFSTCDLPEKSENKGYGK